MFSEKKLILDLTTQSQETFKSLGGDKLSVHQLNFTLTPERSHQTLDTFGISCP